MLRLFQSSNPFTMLMLAVYTVLLNLHTILNPAAVTDVSVHFMQGLIFDSWLHMQQVPATIIAGINIAFIFLQGTLLSTLLQRRKIISKPSLVPALVFILLCSLFPELANGTPEVISGFFIILILFRVFNVYNKNKADSDYFDTGIYSGLLSMIFFPGAILIIFSWISLVRMRSTNVREFAIFLFGILAIWFLLLTGVFWYDMLPEFLSHQFSSPFAANIDPSFCTIIAIVKYALVGILLMVGLAFFSTRFNANLIQVRKYLGAFIWLLLFCIAIIPFNKVITINAIYCLLIPVAIIISYYFFHTKKQLYPELLHLGILGASLLFQYVNFTS